MKWILPCALLLCVFACQPKTEQQVEGQKVTTKAATKTANTEKTATGIPKAEKGITVVRPDGWTDQEMDFQIGYCVSTVSNLTNLNGLQFCECFLSKIQYYYEPRFSKEAYQDQAQWNQECFEAASTE